MFVDLHTHSTTSDGTFSTTDLIRAVKSAGIITIACTDRSRLQRVKKRQSVLCERLRVNA